MNPVVGIVMGSKSDWPVMRHAALTLESLGIGHERKVYSAHRTPKQCKEWVGGLEERGFWVLIAAAGGAAHLAGVCAATTELPVLGVPMESKVQGVDSLLSTVQMPAGIPVGTLAIGKAGAINAALLAAAIVARGDDKVKAAVHAFREEQTRKVLETGDLPLDGE